jgi:hypothetical protein
LALREFYLQPFLNYFYKTFFPILLYLYVSIFLIGGLAEKFDK